jgi:cell division protein FtsA
MNSIDKYIVSIDLGTSKIALTVATVEGNDVQIIYYKESPSAGIKYSGIYNVSQASEALKSAIAEAEQELGIKITQAVMGIPKYPIRTKSAKQSIQDRGDGMEITQEDIEDLKNFALSEYPGTNPESEAVFGAVAQSFSDGENFQIIENDIIGMTSNVLEGHFKIFIGKQSDLKKIDQIMKRKTAFMYCMQMLRITIQFIPADSQLLLLHFIFRFMSRLLYGKCFLQLAEHLFFVCFIGM